MEVSLVRKRRLSIRRLAGFRKGLRVPEFINDSARQFAAKVAEEDIRTVLKEIRDRLRSEFRFKRLELQVDGPTEGGGTIRTPHFSFTIEIMLSEDDPKKVLWQDRVVDIHDPHKVDSKAFDTVFPAMFDTVEVSLPAQVTIETLVDRIEEVDDQRVTLDYDLDCTHLTIGMKGVAGEVEIAEKMLRIVRQKPVRPRLLLKSLFQMQQFFSNSDILLLPSDG